MSHAATERSRARDRLRSFYGVSGSTSSNKAVDIDGSGFEVKAYVKGTLEREGVAGLLRVDNQLVSEVRQIDRDMKTMVYENYSKFISAAETIRRIQHDADVMDAEMGRLSERVRAISAKTAAVDGQFAGRREQIQRLSRERQQLAGLQFLFELPDQLSRLIGRGQFVEAAKAWARTQPLLEHYRQLGVFAAVEKDGQQMMASVEAAIWARWRHPDTGIAPGAECASLLVLLHPDHAAQLWRSYLSIQTAKNRAQRQVFLDQAYAFPAIRHPAGSAAAAAAVSPAMPVPDPSGVALPAVAFPPIADAAGQNSDATRLSHFADCYLPVWSSLVIGFASQFLSPARSGLLEHVGESPPDDAPDTGARPGRLSGRTLSLLEATTEGTVVGLLSPLSEEPAAAAAAQARKREQLVVGWQAMAASELAAAQREFSEHLQEWAAEYEFIVDSLLEHPGSPCADTVDPYLEQLDRLVAAVDEHPILVRIGGLRESTLRVVKRWQQQLIESVLRTIIRDMIERLEYYFDPAIHALDPGGSAVGSGAVAAARVPTPPQAPTTAAGGGGGVRRSSVSRHQRNLSATSVGSQASQANQNQNQRPGSVLSNTWSAALGDRGTPRNSVSSVTGAFNAAQSPLLINTQPNARGLAHARAVSSAFEALGGHSAAGGGGGDWASDMSLSPSLGLFGIPGAQRLSRASTINHPANRSLAQSTISGARAGVLRRAHRQHSHARTLSSVLADMAEDDSEQQHQQQQLQQAPQPLRRSLSMHRGALRRYRPWLIGTVNRNAPLHVFLADTESWLIQQILERVNPLLERVVQHYLDIEGSQLLKDDDDDDGAAGGACSASQPSLQRRRRRLPLRSATKMRQSFIRTLDECLDAWMSDWVPEAFLYAALARPLHGTRAHVDAAVAGSPMAQYGVAAIADPVVSLLLARFAADFELTLTQSIYQLCEHSIAILPDDGAPPHPQRRDPGSVLSSSADAPMADHLHSLTASAPRTDSFASTSRRGTLAGPRPAAGVLGRRQASHAAKWRAVAEALVRNFVMTVGQDISSDYLKVDLHYNASGSGSGGASEESSDGRSVDSVSGVWLSICRWMKQVEDDTNALFHDPVFSATLKALDASQLTRGGGGGSSTDQNSQPLVQPGAGSRPLAHAHILSNIDRLFAERVDVFPPTVSPLNAGQILFHLAMQIIKTALEALRLRPPVLRTRAEFHQIVVDAAFVRSWMLRYAGVAPALGPAALPDAPDPPSPDGLPIANERNVRAIRNLIDDWVASARACALAPDEPSGRLVDDLVFDAWMIAYFNGGRPPRPRA